MSNLNIQLETEKKIHQDPQIQSNDRLNHKRKQNQQETNSTKKKYQKHEIYNHVINNSDKTKVLCKICSKSYNSKSTSLITNLKNHFEKFHKEAYIEILNKEFARKNKQNITQTKKDQQEQVNNETDNNQTEQVFETLFQEEINKKRRKYKRIILENVIIEDDLFNLFVTGLEAENIIIQK
jgi:hypothetical protein